MRQIAAARRQRAEMIATLHSNIVRFLESFPEEHIFHAHPPVAVRLGKGETETEAVERLRKGIKGLRAEMARVRDLPRALSDVRQQIADEVAALVEQGRPNLAGVVGGYGSIEWPDMLRAGGYIHNTLAILAWVNPDGLRARLEEQARALIAQDGITAEERATILTDLDRQCVELERQEEAMLCKLEAAGFTVTRRPDADVRAVLGIADTVPTENRSNLRLAS